MSATCFLISVVIIVMWFSNVHIRMAGYSVENCTHLFPEGVLKIMCKSQGFTDIPLDVPDATLWLYISDEDELTTVRAYTFYQQGYASHLTFLSLYQNKISVVEDASFYGLINLTILSLQSNNISSLRMEMFVGLDQLEQLYLRNNFITTIEPGTFDWLTKVQYLWIGMNRMSTLDSRVLSNQQRPLKQFGLSRFVTA